jgi:hypothetical protein
VLLKHWGELFLKTSISVSLLLRLLGFFRLIVSIIDIDIERTKFEPEQIAEEAKKFTVKITCGD